MKLTLFDLDHTLLAGDSDVLWCRYLQQRGLLDAAEFGPRNAAMEAAYKAGTVSVQAFCEFYVGTLAGRTPQEWAPVREAFLHEVVVPCIAPGAPALVRQHLEAGDLVVLSTATNRVVTELTAAHFGIRHLIATEAERGADGRYTGAVLGTPNMRLGKVERLHQWLAGRDLALGETESCCYSDSINDLPLLETVDRAIAVDPDPRLHAEALARGWPVISLR